MAITYTPSGNVSFSINVNGAVASGTQVLQSYNIPVAASPLVSTVYAGGTSALQVNRLIQASGTLTTSASSVAIISLAGATPTADIVGTTGTWTSVKEIVVFNDGPTTFTASTGTTMTGTWDLIWDMSTAVTTAWGASTTSGIMPVAVAAALTTGPKVVIPLGTHQRFSKPFQTTGGYTVSTTSYDIVLATSGNSGSINYRIIVMGD